MPTSSTSFLPVDAANPSGLLHLLLTISLSGVFLARPLYDEHGEIVDLAWVHLNPAAQQMLRLPECPAESFLTLYPTASETGVFGFYRDAFLSGQVARRQNNYQFDGLDGYYWLVAQRYEDLLVVSFTDTNDQPRTAVEQALRESQAREQAARAEAEAERQRFYEVLQQLPAQVATYAGSDHVFTFVNPRFAAFIPAQNLLGRPVRAAAAGAVGEEVFSLLDRVYSTGEVVQAHEVEVKLASPQRDPATPVFINASYHPLRDVQGRIYGVLDFSYVVTEQVLARRQVEQLNQELETRVQQRTREALALQTDLLAAAQRQLAARDTYYQVFEQTPALIAQLRGPEHRYEYVNPAYQQLFPGMELVGRTLAEAVPETVDAGFVALLDEVYHTGETFFGTELPLPLRGAEGQPARTAYFTFTYQAYRQQGAIIGISVFAYEVTAQVLARQEREAYQQRLDEVFKQAPVAICVFEGPDYVLDVVNPRMLHLWDRPRAGLVGRPLFEAMPELRTQGLDQLLADVRRTGQPFMAQEMEFHLARHQPGETGFYDFVYEPLRNEQHRVVAVLCVAVEVTEQVLARQQVQDLNAELAAINEKLTATNKELHASNTQLTRSNVDLDNFIYTASHDLKAPITNIEGLLLALEHELPAAGRTGDVPLMLTMMQDATERFRRTIAHLTDLSRLQKEYSLGNEAVALAPVVEAVRLDLGPLLAHTRGQLEVLIPEGLSVSFAEKNLRSVVYNLLSNAFKYHHPDRQPTVALRSWLAGDYTVLEVQDNGLGLDLSQGQERLFAMFQRLHTHVEGTGVGLYMVKRIVENAGGHLEVTSQLGQGSTFRVYFRH